MNSKQTNKQFPKPPLPNSSSSSSRREAVNENSHTWTNLNTDSLLLQQSTSHMSSPFSSSAASSAAAQQRHNIHVLFLEDRKGDHLLNRITALLGKRIHKNQGFCHVEIAIPDTSNPQEYLSSSIYNGETVTLSRTKTFANPGYTVMTFTVDGIELSSIADYLHESKRMQLGFDSMGMYLATLPFQINPFVKNSKTFCSKHVTLALKKANIEAVQGLNENIVTPSKLYKVLQEGLRKDRFVIGSVQFKQKALMESGMMFAIQ